MQLIFLDTLDSTSAYASELARQASQTKPFAVAAGQQTAGRGRRGNSWHSPVGNLYVSIVLPCTQVSTDVMPLLPLKAAAVVARLIQDFYGLRITLKWPNDLLFAGRKLGGLLCETSLRGQELGELIVGLGLNVLQTPELLTVPGSLPSDASGYQAISLLDILGATSLRRQPTEPKLLAQRLVDEFQRIWEDIPDAGVLQAYQAYSIEAGQLWQEEGSGALAVATAIAADGSLHLRAQTTAELHGAGDIVLHSAEHRYRWCYQDTGTDDQNTAERSAQPLFIADVGNSRIKLLSFLGNDGVQETAINIPASDFATKFTAKFTTWHQQYAAAYTAAVPGYPLFVLSVRPEAAQALAALAEQCGMQARMIAKRPVLVKGSHYPLNELGIDRLAAMEAVLADLPVEKRQPTQLALVISAGTATTIDVLRLDGEHLGGFILPGLSLALQSLHQATGLLPQLSLENTEVSHLQLGSGTRSAMRQGVLAMTASAALSSLQLWAGRGHEQIPGTLEQIVVTGGHAELLIPALRDLLDHRLGKLSSHNLMGVNASPLDPKAALAAWVGKSPRLSSSEHVSTDKNLIRHVQSLVGDGARVMVLGGRL